MQSSTDVQIGKWGNSLGVRLPKHILESLKLLEKDKLHCDVEGGKLILVPIRKKKYTLEALLSQVKEEPAEEISWGKPEGGEVW